MRDYWDYAGCTCLGKRKIAASPSPTKSAKLFFCSLHFIHAVATSSRLCVFVAINHSGISIFVARSSESVQNVAVMRHQLTTSWGINYLGLYDWNMAAALRLFLFRGRKPNLIVYSRARERD